MRGAFLVVIPARLGSTRFPAKVLADLGGRPVVEWCRRSAVNAGIGPVAVATEDAAVKRALEPYGARVVLTSPRCASGSDRAREVARRPGFRRFPFIMNLQGDEPLVSSRTLRAVARALRRDPEADIATAVTRLDPRHASDPNAVKVVLTADRKCLYFSRSPVPYSRNGSRAEPLWRHIGIYAYRRRSLERFVRLPPSPLERRECLEQLRALEAGFKIVAAAVREEAVAIDTPADLRRARERIRNVTTQPPQLKIRPPAGGTNSRRPPRGGGRRFRRRGT